MATSNEQIRDDFIRHQVDLLRFARGLGSRLVRLLNKGEPELRAQLKGRIERTARLGFDPGPATTARLRRIEEAYRELMRPTWEDVRSRVRTELDELARMEALFMAATAADSLPVVVALSIPTTAELREIVRQTPINGRPLRDWLGQWARNDRWRVLEQIRIGLLFNETPVQVSRRIFGSRALAGADGARHLTRRGAQALANTAMSSITHQVDQQIYQDNADVIQRELYVATLDSKTSPICRALDGKRFPVNEGSKPPLHINCRSRRVPVFDGDVLGERPAVAATERQLCGLRGDARRRAVKKLVGPVPARTNYEQWLRRRSAAFQDEVLGPARGRLFRRGEVTLDRFVDNQGRQYTLDELRERLPRSVFEAARV